jgi:hypothetical protein
VKITKQIGYSVLAGFAVYVSCIALTWIASDQFLAEGPDTRLARLVEHSWDWAFFLVNAERLKAAHYSPPSAALLLLPMFVYSAALFLIIRVAQKTKNA